ncbi:hypothetical protein A2165_01855 [Candidatus Curtissbacteria bacterium RBG_13_40_7]|uniref:BioF2-like acetyltransferase domain-containing protein n=1 Tax=Candidatus Curtissbacteria bacterium RBG_13_40_7 TaxID=1797706 RepID=A0A1F5FWQ2_9BACT|nr:MAG: hypothetical protein A2165_01855 [Candidatus Curtissbacteria bacterium RBG_13_40_7]
MLVREVKENEKNAYNAQVTHIIQSWEWGEFRKKTGLDLVRLGHFEGNNLLSAYQLTFHLVPLFKQTVGYFPKGPMPDAEMIKALNGLGQQKNAAFIKIEPNVLSDKSQVISDKFKNLGLIQSKKSLFTKYNFLIDLTRSEEQLLAAMHPKTRYNIGIAQKRGVEVYESIKPEDFDVYLKLYFETTKRQKYFGHTPSYHKLVWETLMPAKMARIVIGRYQGKPLVAWMLLNFGGTMYYPYGGSSTENKEVMASNLVCWEAIKLAKKMGLKIFDMWGALGPNAKESDPWFGFHRFKAGYGPSHVEYVGTYDLILKRSYYNLLNTADKLRWMYLRTFRR